MLTVSEHVSARKSVLSNGADAVVRDQQLVPPPNLDPTEHVAPPDVRVFVLIENVIRNYASRAKLVVRESPLFFLTSSEFPRSESRYLPKLVDTTHATQGNFYL
jgi:hypothetical protein